jgi:hypothetical protein
VHDDDPVAANWPLSQEAQSAEPEEDFPPAQITHLLKSLPSVQDPAKQSVQDDEPAAAYCPAMHSLQLFCPPGE